MSLLRDRCFWCLDSPSSLAARALFFLLFFFLITKTLNYLQSVSLSLSLFFFLSFLAVAFEPASSSSSSSQSAASEMVILTAVGDEAAAQTWS